MDESNEPKNKQDSKADRLLSAVKGMARDLRIQPDFADDLSAFEKAGYVRERMNRRIENLRRDLDHFRTITDARNPSHAERKLEEIREQSQARRNYLESIHRQVIGSGAEDAMDDATLWKQVKRASRGTQAAGKDAHQRMSDAEEKLDRIFEHTNLSGVDNLLNAWDGILRLLVMEGVLSEDSDSRATKVTPVGSKVLHRVLDELDVPSLAAALEKIQALKTKVEDPDRARILELMDTLHMGWSDLDKPSDEYSTLDLYLLLKQRIQTLKEREIDAHCILSNFVQKAQGQLDDRQNDDLNYSH